MVNISTLRIGQIAEATGVSPRLLRYYEDQDLLHPERTDSGQRRYSEDDVERVERIRRLLAAGLSTCVIAQILACACGGTGDVEPCLDPLLQQELAKVDAKLAQLAGHRHRLAAIVRDGRSPEGDPDERRDPALLLASRR